MHVWPGANEDCVHLRIRNHLLPIFARSPEPPLFRHSPAAFQRPIANRNQLDFRKSDQIWQMPLLADASGSDEGDSYLVVAGHGFASERTSPCRARCSPASCSAIDGVGEYKYSLGVRSTRSEMNRGPGSDSAFVAQLCQSASPSNDSTLAKPAARAIPARSAIVLAAGVFCPPVTSYNRLSSTTTVKFVTPDPMTVTSDPRLISSAPSPETTRTCRRGWAIAKPSASGIAPPIVEGL